MSSERVIELVRPAEPQQGTEKRPDYFDRGERIIMVDGVRWGRTRMEWHGCHGTTVTFDQQGGEKLVDGTGKYPRDIQVRSVGRRNRRVWIGGKYVENPEFKNTEVLALEKAKELVATGKLRDPKIVDAEQAAAHERWQEKRRAALIKTDNEFRERACKALGMNNIDEQSDVLDRVIEAMRWAQTQ